MRQILDCRETYELACDQGSMQSPNTKHTQAHS